MHIDKIKINNFKNYNSAEISFSSKINFLYGKNGAGKTNLLDAIYYLSYGKSMINSFDLENINHNKSFFMISGSYSNNKNYKCTFETSSTKKIFENENKYDNIKQHIGKIPLVFINPYDINLIRNYSSNRRRFFDQIFSQTDNNYLENLISYNRLLKQRNAYLKSLNSLDNIDKNHIKSLLNKKNFMLSINKIPIQGKHNLQNSMAAISVAQILKISNQKIKESLKTFKSIPHRLEHFLTIQKVKYINDSKATNVNSAFYALDSFDGPIIWIAGGVDKGNNYDDLIPIVISKVKAIICLGKDNNKLIDVFSSYTDVIVSTDKISDAVSSAYKISKPGDVVLLSPACASFDLFKSFEDRGDQFKEEVRKL